MFRLLTVHHRVLYHRSPAGRKLAREPAHMLVQAVGCV